MNTKKNCRMAALLMVDVFTNKFYSLAEKQLVSLGGDDTELLGGGGDNYIHIVGSSHGWIALFNEDTLELYLWNPVTRRRINLPPVNSLTSCKVSWPQVIEKLILSSSNPDDADCRVVVLYGSRNSLAFCCPGQSGAGWICIGTAWYHYADGRVQARNYTDMAYSTQQNRLFCITAEPHIELERWDLEDPYSPKIDGDDLLQKMREEVIYRYEYKEGELRSIYLVIVEDEVLVVARKFRDSGAWRDNINDPQKTTGFIIFKVVQGERGNLTVHPLRSLDAGVAMFVGLNDSFALSVNEFPELKPNSIYFTDIFSPEKCWWWRSVCCLSEYDVGIFDYQRQKFYPCYSPQEHNHEEESSEGEEDNQEESSEEEDNDGSDHDEESNDEESSEEDNDIGSEEEDYIYDEQHINVEESSEEEEHINVDESSDEEEEDNDGVFDGEEEEEDNDGSVFYEGKYGPLPTIVWFRPISQL